MRSFSSKGCIEAFAQLGKNVTSASGSWNCAGPWHVVDHHTMHPPTMLLPAQLRS